MKTSNNRSALIGKCLRVFFKFIIISILFISLFHFVIHFYLVKNQDMYPYLCPGDLGVFLTFRPDYSENDVVLYHAGNKQLTGRIKERKESGFTVCSDGFCESELLIKEDALIGKLVFLLRRRNF